MKKLYLIMAGVLCMALVYSCSKSSSSSAMSYTVNNLQDVSVNAGDSLTVAVAVTYTSGTQQPVTLTISGLPANVTVTPTTASGTPTFGTTFVFHVAGSATPGIYPITVTATSKGTTTKTLPFNLTIKAVNYATALTGTYRALDYIPDSANAFHFYNTSITTTTLNQITFNNFRGFGYSITANIVNNDSLYIPAQTINNVSINGGGVYVVQNDTATISYSYNFDSAGVTSHWNGYLQTD